MNDEELIEAKKILAEKRKLLKKYPDKFSLRVAVRQWSYRVAVAEQDESVMLKSMDWGTDARTPQH